MLRENQRLLNRAMRELDRERQKLEQQEKKIIADIKKMAKQGQMVGTKTAFFFWLDGQNILKLMLFEFPPGRREDHGQRFGPHPALRQEVHPDESEHPSCQPEDTDAQVQQQHGSGHERGDQGHGHHEQTGLPGEALAQEAAGERLVLTRRVSVFPQLKLPQIQKIMMEFEKQSEMMDMKEEMMSDAIDDAMGDEEDEDARLEKIPLLPRKPGRRVYKNNNGEGQRLKLAECFCKTFITCKGRKM